MNIIYFHTHDSGRYLDPANGSIALPGIEQLAREAATFRSAFAAAPTCSPSRTSLLTGRVPHRNGMVGLAHRGFRMSDYGTHLSTLLGNAGFRTVLCGIQHESADKHRIGYDRILDGPDEYPSDGDLPAWDRHNADLAVRFLKERHDRPFFLSLGLACTHRPFHSPSEEKTTRRYLRPPHHMQDTRESRADMELFTASLHVVDDIVARVTRTLHTTGLWDDTVVLLTTDHGPPFPEMKGTLYDTGIGVSLIVRIPTVPNSCRGTANYHLVSHLDVVPTVCDLLELATPDDLDGGSLLPLLSGDTGSVRDLIFAETNYHAVYEPARCIRTDRHKLIRHYSSSPTPLPANVDDSPTKDQFRSAGYFAKSRPQEELFDLALDPLERNSVRDDPEYQEIYEKLVIQLERWMTETDDPLLHGTVPRPDGSRLNRPEAWSPTEEIYE